MINQFSLRSFSTVLFVSLCVSQAPGILRSEGRQKLSGDQISPFIPPGYKLDQLLEIEFSGKPECVLASSQDNNDKLKPVNLTLLSWDGKWEVTDKLYPHVANNEPKRIVEVPDEPNYYKELSVRQFDKGKLIFFRSISSAGGSGSHHFYDFYTVENGKLKLVQSFGQSSRTLGYFCFYKGAVFNSELIEKKGELKGNSYVYTCYVDVKKYEFNGNEFKQVGSEHWREKQGNRYLADSYMALSVSKALEAGEIFKNEK
jgi:hypothetical protein